MSPHVFIERSRLGKSFYELRGDHLSISGRRFLQRYEIEVELSDASPQFERLARRFYRPIVVQLSIGAAMSCLTAGLLLQKFIPAEALHHYVLAAGISAAGFVGGGLTWIPRVKVARFKNLQGEVLFDVVFERRYAAEFHEFVEYLHETIVQCKRPNQ
jgi:hypothetical protein